MKKRLFGLLLTVCLVVGIMPTAAFAADGDKMMIMSGTSGIESPTPSAESGNIHYTPNSYIYFGAKSDSPLIRWRVLDANWANDKSTPAVFLLSENLVAGLSLYKRKRMAGKRRAGVVPKLCFQFELLFRSGAKRHAGHCKDGRCGELIWLRLGRKQFDNRR